MDKPDYLKKKTEKATEEKHFEKPFEKLKIKFTSIYKYLRYA